MYIGDTHASFSFRVGSPCAFKSKYSSNFIANGISIPNTAENAVPGVIGLVPLVLANASGLTTWLVYDHAGRYAWMMLASGPVRLNVLYAACNLNVTACTVFAGKNGDCTRVSPMASVQVPFNWVYTLTRLTMSSWSSLVVGT